MNYKRIAFIPFFLLIGCGSDRAINSGVADQEAFPPTFTAIRQRIIEPRCTSCHESFVSHNLLVKKFIVPGSPQASELFEEVENGAMPPYGSKLMDEEIEAIRVWIENGALYE